ncbi:hypothetical protein [Mycolicibacterium hippocampi]|nr:hypothetical protein [Mycolicibacterium hippocampi]
MIDAGCLRLVPTVLALWLRSAVATRLYAPAPSWRDHVVKLDRTFYSRLVGQRGDSFARWYYAQGKGKQFVLCLCAVALPVIGLALIFPLPQQQASNQVVVWCDPQGRKTIDGQETPNITVSRDDPRFDESDLDATMFRLCATVS